MALGMVALVGAVYWKELSAWSGRVGNVASVLGLAVSVVGFALTILTMLATQRISREAERQIRKAVDKARESVERARQETRDAVAKIGLHLLETEATALRGLLGHVQRAVRSACEGAAWDQAIERCEQVKEAAIRLSTNPHLVGHESVELRRAAANVQDILEFITRNRMGEKAATRGLPPKQMQVLDGAATLLMEIQARLRRQLLEVPHAGQPTP